MDDYSNARSQAAKWSKRIGLAAFLFFLVKGLLWLLIPAILAYLTAK